MAGHIDRQAQSWEALDLAWARMAGEASRTLVEDALRAQVEEWTGFVERSRVSGQEPSEFAALYVGRSMSALAHALLQTAYAVDDELVQQTSSFGRVAARYNSILETSRNEALADDPDFSALHAAAVDLLVGAATELAASVGALARAERGDAMVGTRTSELLRRCAALLSGLAYLQQRSVDGPSRAGLRRVAANRPVVRRSFSDQRFASRHVAGRAYGDRFPISGLVTDVGWVARPETPFSYARLDGAQFELRVHYRSMPAVGVAPGRWVWAQVKYEVADGVEVAVAEFEGLGNHAATVWEDWLAEQVRSAYDLAPSSLDVSWELPHPQYRCGSNDLRSRVSATIGG